MTQFVAFDPNAKIRGSNIRIIAAALGESAKPILDKYGLSDVDPEAWYPQRVMLDALRELSEGDFNSTLDMVHMGMRIPEHAVWPPELRTIEDAILNLDAAYQMNHQGDVGRYQVQIHDHNAATITCTTPYPCDLDYGVIYATLRHYLPERSNFVVEHDQNAPCRKNGADSCTYHVHW